MTKEFITYNQALALKELGFGEECFGFYDDQYQKDNSLYLNDTFNKDERFIYTKAPTYSQAFRWFREKHNLCGEVYTVNMGAIDYTFQIRDLYSEDLIHNNFEAYAAGYVGTFLNYEESENACLNKLIEIIKNK